MERKSLCLFTILFFILIFVSTSVAQVCVECHKKVTPGIVNDW